MNPDDTTFLSRRRKLVRWGGPMAIGCLLALAGFYVAMWFRMPLLSNPWHATQQMRNRAIDPPTLELLALMSSVLFPIALGLLGVMYCFYLTVRRTERRYLRIIDTLHPPTYPSEP